MDKKAMVHIHNGILLSHYLINFGPKKRSYKDYSVIALRDLTSSVSIRKNFSGVKSLYLMNASLKQLYHSAGSVLQLIITFYLFSFTNCMSHIA